MRFGVLDQTPVRPGSTPVEALGESVRLAQHVEALGFDRYWLAEHHGGQALAGPAPEILTARIASATSTLRVGTGGVMLMHYSPFKVAEQFRVLEALFVHYHTAKGNLRYAAAGDVLVDDEGETADGRPICSFVLRRGPAPFFPRATAVGYASLLSDS